MLTHDLKRARVTLGEPILVTEQIDHCWFPQIARFSSGALLVTVSLVADAHRRRFNTQGLLTSRDNGASWEWSYTVSGTHRGVIHPRDDDSISLIGTASPVAGSDWRAFSGPSVDLSESGRRMIVEPGAIKVAGLPRPVAPFVEEKVYPGTENRGWQIFNGDVVESGDGLLTNLYLKFQGDERYTTVALASKDGRAWEYRGTIAGPDSAPEAPEGPCEPSMVRLEDGDLMCVLRVGGGSRWNLIRCYSSDEGKTWSDCDTLPAWSVEPCLRRTADGSLVLSTGRIGINLWISTDARGMEWESVDVIEHHNKWAPDEGHRIDAAAPQTTAYTQMVEIEPNRLMLVYDRVPFGWKPVEKGSGEWNRIYAVPVRVERK